MNDAFLSPVWLPGPRYGSPGSVPGLDEVILSVPTERVVCNSRGHSRLGVLADVLATFGHFGERYYEPASLWPESWGRQYAFCTECWDITRKVLEDTRPGLKIIDSQPEPQGS